MGSLNYDRSCPDIKSELFPRAQQMVVRIFEQKKYDRCYVTAAVVKGRGVFNGEC